jgi:protein-tyrosine phosphatase
MDTIVSLLEDSEIAELCLVDEGSECERAGLRFICFPVPDRASPVSEEMVSAIIAELTTELRSGKGIGIHCRIDVGRAAMLAACVMIALGNPVESAWVAVEEARGMSVPDTPAQREWVAGWAARHIFTPVRREERQ